MTFRMLMAPSESAWMLGRLGDEGDIESCLLYLESEGILRLENQEQNRKSKQEVNKLKRTENRAQLRNPATESSAERTKLSRS